MTRFSSLIFLKKKIKIIITEEKRQRHLLQQHWREFTTETFQSYSDGKRVNHFRKLKAVFSIWKVVTANGKLWGYGNCINVIIQYCCKKEAIAEKVIISMWSSNERIRSCFRGKMKMLQVPPMELGCGFDKRSRSGADQHWDEVDNAEWGCPMRKYDTGWTNRKSLKKWKNKVKPCGTPMLRKKRWETEPPISRVRVHYNCKTRYGFLLQKKGITKPG